MNDIISAILILLLIMSGVKKTKEIVYLKSQINELTNKEQIDEKTN